MKTIKQFISTLALLTIIPLFIHAQETGQNKATGNWSGNLDVSGMKID